MHITAKMCKTHKNMPNLHLRTIFYTFLLIIAARGAHNQHSLSRDPAENLFTSLFKKRRVEQLAAVKNLLAMDNEKQHKMVSIITEKACSVIQNSRVILESSGYVSGVSQFPTEEKTLDALANVLENTALIADIVLHLPGISHKILASQQEWVKLFHWSLAFSNQTELLDKQSTKLLYLASQELNFTERAPDYINPYHSRYKKQDTLDKIESQTKKNTKEKKRIRKGPRLSARTVLGEL